ncbi:hypothetical protein MHYP_G00106060 [Metynnis hypsauchen]
MRGVAARGPVFWVGSAEHLRPAEPPRGASGAHTRRVNRPGVRAQPGSAGLSSWRVDVVVSAAELLQMMSSMSGTDLLSEPGLRLRPEGPEGTSSKSTGTDLSMQDIGHLEELQREIRQLREEVALLEAKLKLKDCGELQERQHQKTSGGHQELELIPNLPPLFRAETNPRPPKSRHGRAAQALQDGPHVFKNEPVDTSYCVYSRALNQTSEYPPALSLRGYTDTSTVEAQGCEQGDEDVPQEVEDEPNLSLHCYSDPALESECSDGDQHTLQDSEAQPSLVKTELISTDGDDGDQNAPNGKLLDCKDLLEIDGNIKDEKERDGYHEENFTSSGVAMQSCVEEPPASEQSIYSTGPCMRTPTASHFTTDQHLNGYAETGTSYSCFWWNGKIRLSLVVPVRAVLSVLGGVRTRRMDGRAEEMEEGEVFLELHLLYDSETSCTKSVGTDLSMDDIRNLQAEVWRLREVVASLEERLRRQEDVRRGQDSEGGPSVPDPELSPSGSNCGPQRSVQVEEEEGVSSVNPECETEECSVFIPDSVGQSEQQDSVQDMGQDGGSLSLQCHTDPNPTESVDSSCTAAAQTPLKTCWVRLEDCRTMMELNELNSAEAELEEPDGERGESPDEGTQTSGEQTPNKTNKRKPFPCPACGKRLSSSESLERHVRVHSGEKRGGAPAARGNPAVRQRAHPKERHHKCPDCGKAFPFPSRKAIFSVTRRYMPAAAQANKNQLSLVLLVENS